MSLNWNWTDKMGELTDDRGTYNLYQGNALFIAVCEFEQDGENLYNVQMFACDMEHLKNMLGLKKGYDNIIEDWGWKKIRLNTRYKSVPKIVESFAKAKLPIEIELYYEEEKK